MRFGRIGSVVAVAAVLVTALTACGSSDKDDSSSKNSPPANVQGIEGNTIKVAGLVDGAVFRGADDGFNARIKRANETKELGDFTIEFLGSSDPGGAADKALSTVQSNVERDKVFALGPVLTTGFQQNVATYAAGKGVPAFGSGFTSAWCSPNTTNFSVIGCYFGPKYAHTTPIVLIAKAVGKPVSELRWAVQGLATPDGQVSTNDTAKQIEAEGGKVVYAKPNLPAGGGGDLQPFVSALNASKPDVIYIVAGAEVIGLTAALKQSGYSGVISNSAFYSPGLLNIKAVADAIDGSIITTVTPVIEENTPVVKRLLADFKGIGKSATDLSFGSESGWMTADLMIAMLKKVAPNFEKLAATAQKGFSFTPPKGGVPITWPAAFDENANCATVVKAASTAYEVVVPFSCVGKRVKLH